MKTVMIGLLGVAVVSAPAFSEFNGDGAVPESKEIRFDVLRKGNPFGTHVLTFTQDGEQLRVETEVDLQVKIGPFTPFSYSLDAEEVWKDGQLQSLTGRTVDNGDEFSVSVRRSGDVLNVEGTKFTGEVPGTMPISSWWNPEVLKGQEVISTEDGAITPLTATAMGRERVATRFGEIDANRFRVESDLTLDLWYDDDGHWVKTAFEARGQSIEYVLAEPVSGS